MSNFSACIRSINKSNDLSVYKLNHLFIEKENRDARDYIYDPLNNKITINQPLSSIHPNSINSLNLNAINIPNILIISGNNILNQGTLGSCTANAISVAVSICSNKRINDLCRLYQYFNSKILDNSTPLSDTGATSQNSINALKLYSCCGENLFPYISSNYIKPVPISCFKNTYNITNVVYSYINQDSNMTLNLYNCLLNTNNKTKLSGVIVGFRVYQSFYNITNNGIVPLPNTKKENLLGGHCVAIVGLKNIVVNGRSNLYIVFQNSWGTSWGDKGYGYFPVQYLQNSSLSEPMTVVTFIV